MLQEELQTAINKTFNEIEKIKKLIAQASNPIEELRLMAKKESFRLDSFGISTSWKP
jgi:superoxide dismutase